MILDNPLKPQNKAISSWQEIFPSSNVWVHQDTAFNTIIVKASSKLFLVISPTKGILKEEYLQVLDADQTILALAPNHFHHFGIEQFKDYFPSATICCSEVAKPRLESQVKKSLQSLESLLQYLPKYIKVIFPKGTKNGEVWLDLSFSAGNLLIIGDAFINLPTHLNGLLGFALRLCQATPQLQISKTWNWFGLADANTYKSWLKDYLSERTHNWIIPLHGNVIAGSNIDQTLIELADSKLS